MSIIYLRVDMCTFKLINHAEFCVIYTCFVCRVCSWYIAVIGCMHAMYKLSHLFVMITDLFRYDSGPPFPVVHLFV